MQASQGFLSGHQSQSLEENRSHLGVPLRSRRRLSKKAICTKQKSLTMLTRESWLMSKSSKRRSGSLQITDRLFFNLTFNSLFRFFLGRRNLLRRLLHLSTLCNFIFDFINEYVFFLFYIKHYIFAHGLLTYLRISQISLLLLHSDEVQDFYSQLRAIWLHENRCHSNDFKCCVKDSIKLLFISHIPELTLTQVLIAKVKHLLYFLKGSNEVVSAVERLDFVWKVI